MAIVGFDKNAMQEVYGASTEEMELAAAHSVAVMEEWMSSRKLDRKTEVVIISNRKSEHQLVVSVGNCTLTFERFVKHPVYSSHTIFTIITITKRKIILVACGRAVTNASSLGEL